MKCSFFLSFKRHFISVAYKKCGQKLKCFYLSFDLMNTNNP